jgi:pimeloyl-ACP methyl ester carboxylesterase
MTLYVREAGPTSAPAIMFLHGGGLSSRQWIPQIERLSDAFHCLAPDLPEHGQSLDVGPLTMDLCVDEAAKLIREKAGGKAHMVGLSMGGAVAVTLLARMPDVVDHMMISGTAQPLGQVLAWMANLNAPFLKVMSKDQVANAMAKQFGIPPDQREQIEDIKLLTPDAVLRTTTVLKEIRVPVDAPNPVLVCVGEKETLPAKNMGRKYVKMLRNVRGVIAPGGHVWNLQYADLFAETVRAWVTDSPLPDGLRELS